jgi:hypothetical protein
LEEVGLESQEIMNLGMMSSWMMHGWMNGWLVLHIHEGLTWKFIKVCELKVMWMDEEDKVKGNYMFMDGCVNG